MKNAQYRAQEGSIFYKIGIHDKVFMWVNDEWILTRTKKEDFLKRTQLKEKDDRFIKKL